MMAKNKTCLVRNEARGKDCREGAGETCPWLHVGSSERPERETQQKFQVQRTKIMPVVAGSNGLELEAWFAARNVQGESVVR